jgi:hypothetical protein
MRFKHLAVGIALSLIPAFAPAQSVTVHSDGVTGNYATIQEAVNAVLADAATPDVITILNEGPFIGPAIAVNDTPVGGVQPFNVTDFTLRGAEGVKPLLVSTALSGVINISHVYGRIRLENMILTGGTPNESTASALGPQRAITYTSTAGDQNASGRAIDFVIDNVVITSSVRTQEDPPIYVPVTTDGITIAGINAPAIVGDLCTLRAEGLNVASTSQSLVNRLEFKNSVISGLPRAPYGFRTFFDGGPGTECIVGPNVVISYVTGQVAGATQAAGGIQVGGNDGALNILKVRGTAEQPIIVHGNRRGVDITGNTPVGSIKTFENVIISDSLLEGFLPRHPTENYIFQNVTIANSGQDPSFDDAEPITNGWPWPFEAWQGSVVSNKSIIAGNGTEDFRNLIRVVTNTDPAGTATFEDSGIVLAGPFKLNTADYANDGFDGLGTTSITRTDILTSDPQFISTTLGNADFYRPGSAAYIDAGILGGYSEEQVIPPSFVTVHSDGVTGDFGNIQDAINAVQGNPTTVGVVEILDEGPFVQGQIIIPGGGLETFVLRGAVGVRPIIAGLGNTGTWATLRIQHFYGNVTLQNLLVTSADPVVATAPTRGIWVETSGAAHNTAGTPMNYTFDDIVITSSVVTEGGDVIPVTTDGITVAGVNAALPAGNFCTLRNEGFRGDSNSSTIISSMVFKNSVISGLTNAADGFRSFFDGGEGSELVVGPNVVLSYIVGTVGTGALQVGGNDGALHILKVLGDPEDPIFIHGNRRGVNITGTAPAGAIKSFRNVLISDSLLEGFATGHPTETYNLDNVTIVNSGLGGGAQAEAFAPVAAWNGILNSRASIFAGNGSETAGNTLRTVTTSGGTAVLADGAVVLNGSYRLTGDGFNDSDPSNVTSTNNLNADPQFISTVFGNVDFYRPGATAYTAEGVLGAYGTLPIPPAYVTVHTDGVTGDYSDIQLAVDAVMASDAKVVIVEILNDGPWIQDEITITPNSSTVENLTLRGAEGVRPLLVGVGGGPGGINSWATIRTNHFYGKVTLQNLIVTSGVPSLTENPVRAIWLQTGAGNQDSAGRAVDYLIDDVLITSSVRTSTDPLTFVPVTLDGITVAGVNAPLPAGDYCTIRAETVRVDSTSNNFVNRLALQNSVISAMTNTADAFRTFFDGAEGSEVMVGPNVLISYIVGTAGGVGALQVGGNEGSDHILKVRGTPESPIILHGNRRAVSLTGTTRAGSIKSFENMLISDSMTEGFFTADLNENYVLENVTIVNSGTSVDPDGARAFTPSAAGWTGTLATTNTIFAGKGTDGINSVIRTFSDAGTPGTAVLVDGAIVLNGPFRLNTADFNNDGLDDTTPSNVTSTNNLSSDPQFISTVLGNADFYRAGSSAYATAGVSGAYGAAVVPPVELGDLNGDGVVNVADVTELAGVIAAGQQGSLDPAVADINGDTVINDADVAALADAIVNP